LHVATIEKTLSIAAKGILLVWRTTPTAMLFRDAGLPSIEAALEGAKLQFATHLRAIDTGHPLASCTVVAKIN
jgi:hypothetical protein